MRRIEPAGLQSAEVFSRRGDAELHGVDHRPAVADRPGDARRQGVAAADRVDHFLGRQRVQPVGLRRAT